MSFFVSDEMSLNDCIDCLDENELQHDADLFFFVENDFLQSSHVNDFFSNQFEHSRRICINQRLDDDRHAAIIMKNENVDFDRMHQNFENVQLHSDLDIIQSDSLKMLTEKSHVLFLANEELEILAAKILKSQNSIHRRIVQDRSVRDFTKLVFHVIDERVRFCDDLNDCFVLQTFYNVFVVMLYDHAQIACKNSHHRFYLFFFFDTQNQT